jgi:2,3-dihydroxybiphenyl 1,2-dioxygenase
MTTLETSVFGAVHLGYLVVETEKFADWRRFGRDAIGMQLDEALPDIMRFRLDDDECRFLLQRGPAEDVTAFGWKIDDHASFDTIESRIRGHGVPVTRGSAEEAQLRGVERFLRFPGPNGVHQEIYVEARRAQSPLELGVRGGFVTGDAGMGHVAIATKKPHQMRAYYNTVFDARLSDYIDETISGLKFKIRFLRVNERHHTVAIASVNRLPLNPIRTRIQHCNIQVADLDDMTASYQRVKELGFHMALSVGQHTNDKELSYYAVTPSGFEWEVGWNPIVVDESTWEITTHQDISIWGHTPEGHSVIQLLERLKTSAQSVLHAEDSVPALAGSGIADD